MLFHSGLILTYLPVDSVKMMEAAAAMRGHKRRVTGFGVNSLRWASTVSKVFKRSSGRFSLVNIWLFRYIKNSKFIN